MDTLLVPAAGGRLRRRRRSRRRAARRRRLAAFELVESYPIETSLDHPDIPDAHDVWLAMIDGARRRIDLAQFYASNRAGSRLEAVVQSLERAADRGVVVRFLARVEVRCGVPGHARAPPVVEAGSRSVRYDGSGVRRRRAAREVLPGQRPRGISGQPELQLAGSRPTSRSWASRARSRSRARAGRRVRDRLGAGRRRGGLVPGLTTGRRVPASAGSRARVQPTRLAAGRADMGSAPPGRAHRRRTAQRTRSAADLSRQRAGARRGAAPRRRARRDACRSSCQTGPGARPRSTGSWRSTRWTASTSRSWSSRPGPAASFRSRASPTPSTSWWTGSASGWARATGSATTSTRAATWES